MTEWILKPQPAAERVWQVTFHDELTCFTWGTSPAQAAEQAVRDRWACTVTATPDLSSEPVRASFLVHVAGLIFDVRVEERIVGEDRHYTFDAVEHAAVVVPIKAKVYS